MWTNIYDWTIKYSTIEYSYIYLYEYKNYLHDKK